MDLVTLIVEWLESVTLIVDVGWVTWILPHWFIDVDWVKWILQNWWLSDLNLVIWILSHWYLSNLNLPHWVFSKLDLVTLMVQIKWLRSCHIGSWMTWVFSHWWLCNIDLVSNMDFVTLMVGWLVYVMLVQWHGSRQTDDLVAWISHTQIFSHFIDRKENKSIYSIKLTIFFT